MDCIENGNISDLDLSDEETNTQIQEVESASNEPGDTDEEVEESEHVPELEVTSKKDIQWRRGVLFVPPQNISWDAIEHDIDEILQPKDYFARYIPDSFFELMATETNIYSLQNGDTNFAPTTVDELKTFVGLHILMGSLKYPRIRMYWDTALKNTLFTNSMPVNRFFKLRKNLHCVNVTDRSNTDKLWKVRPIFDIVRARCNELSLEEYICVDEQMVPFRGQLTIKQYVKGKPCPWGIKIFVLCGASGQMYDFIIYQGITTELDKDNIAKFGQGASVVIHLVSNVVKKENHKLFFDNYFTSYNLLEVLAAQKIWAAGTVRTNRFANPPFTSDSEMKKKERGFVEEIVSRKGDVSMVKWYDNKPVVLASNFTSIGEMDEVKRWNKSERQYVNVRRPEIVRLYNQSMGGVDKLDFLVSLYRIFVKSRKWTLRMIFHAVDLAVVNSWLEYKRDASTLKLPAKDVLDLLHFRIRLAESLILEKKPTTPRSRGRPSKSSEEPVSPPPKKSAAAQKRPILEVQHDMVDHLPEHSDSVNAGRCKQKNCTGKSRWKCCKCSVYLCLNKDRNCFKDFHRK